MPNFYRSSGICLLLLSLVFSTSAFSDDSHTVEPRKDQLVLGLLPFVSPERLDQRFAPLSHYLSRKLDFDIAIETAPNFREFVERTAGERRYDLLFTAPHFYYRAQRDSGYRVVARVAGPPMNAVIVTHKTSKIFTIDDLRGRKLAIPDPISLAALLTREYLAAQGATLAADVTLVETPTHNASLLSMHHSRTDAASLMGPIFWGMPTETKAKLRVIAKTAAVPRMPISVAPWITADQASAFTRAMLEIKNTQEGRALLKRIGWPGFVAARPQDYDFFGKFAAAIDLTQSAMK